MELAEKLESVFTAYLKQFVDGDISTIPPNTDIPASFYWPASLQNADKTYRIYAGESDTTKDGQAILCISGDSHKEEPQYSGNYFIPFEIWLRTPVAKQTAKQISDLEAKAITNHKAAATMLEHAIMQDPFVLALNVQTLAGDLTIYSILDRQPQRQQLPNYYASGWAFRVYCMSKSAP